MMRQWHNLRAWFDRWYGDTRGTSMITTAVTLPLLIVIIFGIFRLFQVMTVKWFLDRGTREAARYISEDARYWDLKGKATGTGVLTGALPANYYDIEAKRIIMSRLRDVFDDNELYNHVTRTLLVTVTEPILAVKDLPGATPDPDFVDAGELERLCKPFRKYNSEQPGEWRPHQNIRFRVMVELEMPLAWFPRLPYTSDITPTLRFKNRAVGYVQCPRWVGTPRRDPTNPDNFDLDKSRYINREGPALPYRNLATPWYPTVTPVPTSTPVPPTDTPAPPTSTPAPTNTP